MDAKVMMQKITGLQEREKRWTNSIARLEGEQKQILARLKDEFGLVSLDAARDELMRLQGDIEKREARLEKQILKLEEAVADVD